MNDNPNLNFVLTLQEANTILAILQELPAKVANPLTQKMTEQAKSQIEKFHAEAKAVSQNQTLVTDV